MAGGRPLRVISGGQTGVDRAALDTALALGLETGGWCPKGRRAEDGSIPDHYPLTETSSANYSQRTELNVRDSDATLILSCGELSGGTALTYEITQRLGKQVQVADLSAADPVETVEWIDRQEIAVLNVAGPRESGSPGVYMDACGYLEQVFTNWSNQSPP